MPLPARIIASARARRTSAGHPRRAARTPTQAARTGAALPAACVALLAAGMGPAAETASAALTPPSRDHGSPADAADPFANADALLPLAGPQSVAGFQRALGIVPPALPGGPAGVAHGRSRRRAQRGADTLNRAIAAMTAAGDRIATRPYVYGGGHGSFIAGGYDCSGSVSFVLHAAGLLSIPDDSSGLESFGEAGPGRRVTIYADAQHAFMTIDGRRFDTIAFQETGTRWSSSPGATGGYVVRHPAGM